MFALSRDKRALARRYSFPISRSIKSLRESLEKVSLFQTGGFWGRRRGNCAPFSRAWVTTTAAAAFVRLRERKRRRRRWQGGIILLYLGRRNCICAFFDLIKLTFFLSNINLFFIF